MLDPRDALAFTLLSTTTSARADHPELVVIKTEPTEDCTRFIAEVHPTDVQRLIGRHGSNANSVRTILAAIGWKEERRYALAIHGDPG